jgi:L-asparaginase/Glu-tRNA(Gln) amidotransferase subunit D
MDRDRIAVFSGPRATIANSPTLVTGNKGRLPQERALPGRYDHLVPQVLHEPVVVRIRKYSAHPLEEDAESVYLQDGKDYYEVELLPEDGPYPLPYVARRANGSGKGQPFEDADLFDPSLDYGGRQFFYPDASRMFTEIDRTISGRDESGEGSTLDRKADFDFIRVLPPGGYTQNGEKSGVDFFPYRPLAIRRSPRYRDLAKATNSVQAAMSSREYAGGIWMEGSPTVEETLYWLSLLIDTDRAIAGIAAQRPHGQLANDGDRNIVDAVDYVLSGLGSGIGAVGVQDEQIYAAREFKKADDRPGNYKATGGHGGILGTVGPPVTIWYKPAYRHTASSDVNLSRLPASLEFLDFTGDGATVRIDVKDDAGALREESIPRVHIVKYGAYMDEDETADPDNEVDIMARISKGLADQRSSDPQSPKLHGFVLEGSSPYGLASMSQHRALEVATFSGMPVVRVGRADPGGRVPSGWDDLTIAGSNLDCNKARLLLMAAMLKLGRLPKARDPRNPTKAERHATVVRVAQFQEIFENH